MPDASDQVLALLRRVVVGGPHTASLDGLPVGAGPGATSDPPVVEALALAVYSAFHCGLPPGAVVPQPDEDAEAVPAELAAANAGRDRWDEGWVYLRAASDGRVVAGRGSAVRTWWPGHWLRADGLLGALTPGTPLRLLHGAGPRHSPQPGFWFAFGSGGPDTDRRLLRFYLNAERRNAAEVVGAVTTRLHAFTLPFQLKVAAFPSMLARLDSAVLYVEARHFRLVAQLVAEAVAGLREPLAAGTPPLTKPLLPGVGIAEQDGAGTSFGLERSRALADGLWLAFAERATDATGRLDAVRRAFAMRGIDLARPWLAARENPDRYELAA